MTETIMSELKGRKINSVTQQLFTKHSSEGIELNGRILRFHTPDGEIAYIITPFDRGDGSVSMVLEPYYVGMEEDN